VCESSTTTNIVFKVSPKRRLGAVRHPGRLEIPTKASAERALRRRLERSAAAAGSVEKALLRASFRAPRSCLVVFRERERCLVLTCVRERVAVSCETR
jgi:hypothetical protein